MGKCDDCQIKQYNAFRSLGEKEMGEISAAKTKITLKRGETLFREGEQLNGVFCARSGVSILSKLSENGKDQIIKLTRPGELLGQRCVIAGEWANLSAIAVSDMEACFIPRELVLEKLQHNPGFSWEVLRHMSADLKEADDVIVNMSQKSVKQRLAEAFLYLKDNFGEDGEGYLKPVLLRSDLANIVGTANESLIRMVSNFKKEGLIRTSGKRVAINREDQLREIAAGV